MRSVRSGKPGTWRTASCRCSSSCSSRRRSCRCRFTRTTGRTARAARPRCGTSWRPSPARRSRWVPRADHPQRLRRIGEERRDRAAGRLEARARRRDVLHAGAHGARDRGRSRARRDPAELRHHVPAVRLRPSPRVAPGAGRADLRPGSHPGAVADGVVRSKYFVTEPVELAAGAGTSSGAARVPPCGSVLTGHGTIDGQTFGRGRRVAGGRGRGDRAEGPSRFLGRTCRRRIYENRSYGRFDRSTWNCEGTVSFASVGLRLAVREWSRRSRATRNGPTSIETTLSWSPKTSGRRSPSLPPISRTALPKATRPDGQWTAARSGCAARRAASVLSVMTD